MTEKGKMQSCCDLCLNYYYDDDTDSYACAVNLDEDEMAGFLLHQRKECPFFRFGDEYTIVRKQN